MDRQGVGRRRLEVEGRGGGHGDHAGVLVDREGVAGVPGGDGRRRGVVVARVGEVDDRRGGGGGLWTVPVSSSVTTGATSVTVM